MERRAILDDGRQIGRRSVIHGLGGLAALAWLPGMAAAQPAGAAAHAPSAALVQRLRTRMTFQLSVDVGTLDLGLRVAAAGLAAGVDIIEMGTPLLKTQGVANVVPAFRRRFPDALLLADMKSMDGAGGEARSVYEGGANIIDFLALAGADSARAVCAVRDEFRRRDPAVPRLAFADILLPQQGGAAQAGEVALRMIDAGVDSIGLHLQVDARRANPRLIANDYLGEVARAVWARIGANTPVQVVGGLHIAQAQRLARAGLRGFVISGNMGLPDGEARYTLPPAEIERLARSFITEVSGTA